uniref:Trafficking protein particle complex subunit 8 (inferred by orthology to a human protein) n=1 Tax=Strongyloides venezuelensis TaxID=75913 RepID=A0A0K0G2K8_STRVS
MVEAVSIKKHPQASSQNNSQTNFKPMIALINSNGVYDVCGKNNLTLADMLHPYSHIFATVRDPSNISTSSKLKIDIRDIKQSGSLLSLTVLPSVLDQGVTLAFDEKISAYESFVETLNYWQEPGEHEFLGSYISCIFAISAHENNPLEELDNLITQQRQQQHSNVEVPDPLPCPGHCAPPKWFMNNILKFYVLVQDVSLNINVDGIYKQMITTYGTNNCHLLRINSSTVNTNLPDIWSNFIDKRDTILELGLELARTKIAEKASSTNKSIDTDISTPSTRISVTSSSANPRIADDYLTYLSVTTGAINTTPTVTTPNTHTRKKIYRGMYLDSSDRERLIGLIEDFTINALIPFVERQLKVLNDGWINRKGFAKSLTLGVKKWFGPVTSTNITPSKVVYSPECGELQSRRLADLCVLFGLYSYALPVYQSLKKDFEHDGSWLHYAGTLEMASVCLGTSALSVKDYPKHYMENALNHYTISSHKPLIALRAGIESYEILVKLNCFEEAATQMVKLASFNFGNDLYPAILSELASEAFRQAKMYRKMCFQYVLTGYRYIKCNQKKMALDCYRKALPEIINKAWNDANDHILHTLANDFTNMNTALEYAEKLVREESDKPEKEQNIFLQGFIDTLLKNNTVMPEFKFPVVKMNEIKVIYGNIPDNCDSAVYTSDKQNDKWDDLEKAAYHTIFPDKKSFKKIHIWSDNKTENVAFKETPQGEKCRIVFSLENNLTLSVKITNIKLGFQYIKLVNNDVGTESDLVESEVLPCLILQPSSITSVGLFFIPGSNISEVSIDSIIFDLHSESTSITGFIPINVRGQKVFKKNEDSTYKGDNRLTIKVSKDVMSSMKVNLFKNNENSTSISSYCNQIFQITTDIENLGPIEISGICVATDKPNLISVSEPINNTWQLCDSHLYPTNENILVYNVMPNKSLNINESCQVKFSFKAPPVPVKGESISLIVYWKGINGTGRYKRFQLSFTTQHLLKAKTRLIDPFVGLCAVDFKNSSDSKDAVLVKIEILRMRTIYKSSPILKINTNGKIVKLKDDVTVESDNGSILMSSVITDPTISIDNAQGYTLPFYLMYHDDRNNDSAVNYTDDLWLGQVLQEFPSFSNHLHRRTFLNPQQKDVYSFINPKVFENLSFVDIFGHFNIFVLWKASIFNVDGAFTTIFGESSLVNPFLQYNPSPTSIQEVFLPPQLSQYRIPNTSPKLLFIPSDTDSLQLKQAITEDQFMNATEMKSIDLWTNPVLVEHPLEAIEQREIASAVKANVYFNTNIIEHNFAIDRICTVPVNIEISNYDRRCRYINATVICSSSIPKINALYEKYYNHQFTNNPIVPHSHLICNMSKVTKLVPPNDILKFTLQLKAALPSVFDTSCLSISVSFKNSPNSVQLQLPSHHISIIDISLANHIPETSSRCSSVPVT